MEVIVQNRVNVYKSKILVTFMTKFPETTDAQKLHSRTSFVRPPTFFRKLSPAKNRCTPQRAENKSD